MSIDVLVDGMYGSYAAATELSDLQRKCFEPIKTTDHADLAAALGETMAGSMAEKVVIKTRKDAAEEIAERLAGMIYDAMRANDTHNGYPVNESKDSE